MEAINSFSEANHLFLPKGMITNLYQFLNSKGMQIIFCASTWKQTFVIKHLSLHLEFFGERMDLHEKFKIIFPRK